MSSAEERSCDPRIEASSTNVQIELESKFGDQNVAGQTEDEENVDFVLTYEEITSQSTSQHPVDDNKLNREKFQSELQKRKLKLTKCQSVSLNLHFILIHVPFDVMCEYAEKLEMVKPLKNDQHYGGEVKDDAKKKDSEMEEKGEGALKDNAETEERGMFNRTCSHSDSPMRLAVFCQNSNLIFDIPKDKESFFTSSERAQVVWYIMRRIENSGKHLTIYSLLADGTYKDAYYLHGDSSKTKRTQTDEITAHLKYEWAQLNRWYKAQPLDRIRDYFGDEVALYFAWLGVYTKSLILPAIVGIACFLYGFTQWDEYARKPMEEVCYGEIGEEMICALCQDASCSEEKLRTSCGTRILLLMFDNPATLIISIFMSFWATGFLIHWKRTQARLTLKWEGESMLSAGGSDRDTWEVRPEYKSPTKLTEGSRTHKEKPPLWGRFLRIFTPISVVVFMVAIVVVALVGIIMYGISVNSALYLSKYEYIRNNSKNLTSFTAAIINLAIILLLKWAYGYTAIWLTDLENPKTQAEYDRSHIMKVYIFEFFNCYSSLFYIAFIKGRFFTYPNDPSMSASFLAQDNCDSAGCLAELLIQLAVIMGGKQLLNLFREMILPRINKWWKSNEIVLHTTRSTKKTQPEKNSCEKVMANSWEKNYQLLSSDRFFFFQEILEIVIQYGFVTLFVAAFPLAPLFAVLNNAAEIRVDADKLLTQYRRIMPHRTKALASWNSIMQAVTYLAVAVNGCIIAFTSEFIPRIVYTMALSKDGSLSGYVNFTLSVYYKNSSDMALPFNHTCRYRGFREPPGSENPYSFSPTYWHVLAMQLLFVIVFEHVVLGLSSFIAYYIPEVPRSVELQAHVERKKTRNILPPPAVKTGEKQ